MRTERRQELRTNELSQQIEGITEYMKRNATAMTIVVVVAAVAVGGGFLYKNSQTQKRMEAWAAISVPGADATPASMISRAESIAAERLSPGLTTAAQLTVGQIAMQQMAMPSAGEDDAESAEKVDWKAKAQSAYEKIANQRDADAGALGQAYIALGILAEDDGEITKAAEWYKKLVDDERFAATPYKTQAQFRMDHLDEWATPVVFAPPPPAPLAPIAPASTGSDTPITITPKAAGDAQPPVASPQQEGEYVNKKIDQLKKHDKPAESETTEKPATTPDASQGGSEG